MSMFLDLDTHPQSILKATVAGNDPISNKPQATTESILTGTGVMEPPYDPAMLCRMLEHSNSLRQNVDAYATNIDGFGHRLEPTVNFAAENADHEVARSLVLEKMAQGDDAPAQPRPRDVARRRRELEMLAEAESARLATFFDSCCFDHSFVELRRRTRQDLEVTGNAYWEVLRNAAGRIARLVHVPAHTVRLLPLDNEPVEMIETTRISPVSYESMPVQRRVRRYVQQRGLQAVYYKSLGDRRVIGRVSGSSYADLQAQREEAPDDLPASEMVHFAIHSPHSPYGVPRWIGSLLSVLGSRQMEEVNFMYFTNKSVPPLALLVSGGKLSESSIPRVQNFIEENIKGKNNFHKILILEAESGGSTDSTKTKIELKPLTNAQQQDALFQNYDERNIDKVGASFRMPRILRGESKDFNRAVADAQMRFCEDQVFQPERAEFDHFMNHRLLPDMGIRMWRFKSQSPITRDPERLTDSIERLVRVGVLTPEEGRVLAADVFNREFRCIGDAWTKRPITLTLAGIQTQGSDSKNGEKAPYRTADGALPVAKSRLSAKAQELIALREELQGEEKRLAERALGDLREHLAPGDGHP